MALSGRPAAGGFDEIGDGLGLGQIQLVVEEGALAELAGRAGRIPSICRMRRISMSRMTGPPWPCSSNYVFAGEAVGALKTAGRCLIQRLALLVD